MCPGHSGHQIVLARSSAFCARFRPVRKQIAIFSLLLAWLCANGALLDTAQVFALARMFAGYSGSMDATAALRETFNPAKPCKLCHGIAKAKQTAREQLPSSVERSGEKILLALHSPTPIVFVAAPADWPTTLASVAPSRTEAVPVPPPRV